MSDEIKEILDKAKEISDYGADGKQHTRMFNQFEAKALLDYITNLQQQVRVLTKGLEATDKAYKDYKSRCKRAIEIIDMYGCYNSITEDKLYSCLRGNNNE